MSDRWFIFKGDKAVGPYTAEEIRASLRDGSVDPFDQVAREGSSLRRHLVDVDEIFQTSQAGYSVEATHPPSSPTELTGFKPTLPEDDEKPQEQLAGQGPLMLANQQQDTRQNVPPPVAAEPAPPVRPRLARRREPKCFHLINGRGRVLGPLSAQEIQGLYYKGILDRSARVNREGSGVTISIDRFIAAYSARGIPARVQQGAHPALRFPLQRVLAGPRRISQTMGPLSMAAVALALVLSCAAAWIFYNHVHDSGRASSESRTADHSGDRSAATERTALKAKKPAPPKMSPQPKTPPKPKKTEVSTRRAPAPSRRPPSPPSPAPKAQTVRSSTSAARAQARLQERIQAERAAAAARERERLRQMQLREAQRQRERALANQRRAQVPPRPATPVRPAVAAAPAGASVRSLVNGQNVTRFGPLHFDRGAVQRCDGSCSIAFSGRDGSIRVVFFKEVWGPTLLGKKGTVHVSGLVRKDGAETTLVLSGVH